MRMRFIKSMTPQKRAIAAIAAIALITVAMMVGSCASSPGEESQENPQVEEEQVIEADPDSALMVDAEWLRDSYDPETLELVAILEQNAWGSPDGAEVQFHDGRFVQSSPDAGFGEEQAYVVTSIDRQRYNGAGATYDVTTASIIVPEGARLLRLDHTLSATGESWTLSSDILNSQRAYERTSATDGVKVEGGIEEVSGLVDDSVPTMIELIEDMCAVYYPSASIATWTRDAQIDYELQELTTTFLLNNAAATHLAVIYHMDTQTYEFG